MVPFVGVLQLQSLIIDTILFHSDLFLDLCQNFVKLIKKER